MKKLGIISIACFVMAVPAASAESGDAKKAKAYLAEVKKHLLESYVGRDKLTDEGLTKTALKGFRSALTHKDFSHLTEEVRAEIRDGLEGVASIQDAIDATDKAAGDEKLDLIRYADHGARAMVKSSGDPFSRILTQKDFNKLLGMMRGSGRKMMLGVSVRAKDGTVAYVRYGYPAYDEGIEIGDVILEAGGEPLRGKTQGEVNKLLKLKENSALVLKIRKPGHARTYEFRIHPRKEAAPNVQTKYLGQGVGYLRLAMFDMGAARQVKKGLKKLKKQGMKALILDLRHNPGGALPASTAIADLFLPQGLVITTTKSNYKPSFGGMQFPGLGGNQTYKTKKATEFEEMPMIVLVNHASASASELLSGALQDHKRAVLIGATTYGKGIGQSPIFLQSMFFKRYLYLTVMTYDLPSGRSIHHKGVVPDIAYPKKKRTPREFAAIWKLRSERRFAKYVDTRWGRNAERLSKLAEYDGFEWSQYPGFQRFFGTLDTRLSKDAVRAELRRAIRRRLSRQEGIVWVTDLETDMQLQRGLVGLLEIMGK